MITIIERAVAGEFDGKELEELLEAVDDEIDRWHSPETDDDRDLNEFLGMSKDEYNVFIVRPSAIVEIIRLHRWVQK